MMQRWPSGESSSSLMILLGMLIWCKKYMYDHNQAKALGHAHQLAPRSSQPASDDSKEQQEADARGVKAEDEADDGGLIEILGVMKKQFGKPVSIRFSRVSFCINFQNLTFLPFMHYFLLQWMLQLLQIVKNFSRIACLNSLIIFFFNNNAFSIDFLHRE